MPAVGLFSTDDRCPADPHAKVGGVTLLPRRWRLERWNYQYVIGTPMLLVRIKFVDLQGGPRANIEFLLSALIGLIRISAKKCRQQSVNLENFG